MADQSAAPSLLTSFALGPVPAPAAMASPAGPVPSAYAAMGGDFWHSPSFGLLLLALIIVYMHTRIL